MDLSTIRRMFAFDAWANARLFRALAALSTEQYARPLGSSFSSIRDTMAHIVAAEWIWLQRWHGESPSAFPEWAAAPDRAELRSRLDAIEAERDAFLDGLSAADLQRVVSYRNLKGEPWAYPLGMQLVHVLNHSTYHRGQLATMCRQVGAAAPATDLLVFLDETTHRA
jgi:uncharacterized damage-inducible protein DinB